MRFEFATATRIIFGSGVLEEVSPLAAQLGKRVLVVLGNSVDRGSHLLDRLAEHGMVSQVFQVSSEPTVVLVQEGAALARESHCDLVVGLGGGSVIDAGKAIAALVTNPGDPLDYLEVIGRGQPLANPPLPYIAIPTTAGTGAEVTRNAVLASPGHRVKVSLRSPLMLPRLAVVDPLLTHSLPPEITASTGLDALTQVIEPYVSHLANPMTDAICREGIQRAARSLQKAWENGDDPEAREDMALTSLFGGLALANAKLGAVHGFAGPLGGMYPGAPHGVICGKLLPFVMSANVRALSQRMQDSPAVYRFAEVSRLLTGADNATPEDGVAWIRELCDRLAVPGLSTFGVDKDDFPTIIEKASHASSMKGNPIQLTHEELQDILEQAL